MLSRARHVSTSFNTTSTLAQEEESLITSLQMEPNLKFKFFTLRLNIALRDEHKASRKHHEARLEPAIVSIPRGNQGIFVDTARKRCKIEQTTCFYILRSKSPNKHCQ